MMMIPILFHEIFGVSLILIVTLLGVKPTKASLISSKVTATGADDDDDDDDANILFATTASTLLATVIISPAL